MISLEEFFTLNYQLILFVYGLGFFVLGFAILLQVQQSSRLELARSLRWLAAFGITHAFNEWGDLFIPIQAQYLSSTMGCNKTEKLPDLHREVYYLSRSFTALSLQKQLPDHPGRLLSVPGRPPRFSENSRD